MRREGLGVLLALLVLFAPTVSFSQPEIDVVDVTWGALPNRIGVGPGDRAVPLSITVQNLGSDVVSGIVMKLKLTPPFSNLTGGEIASSYVSISLQPGQAGSAQFMLNVADNATIGEYTMPLTIEYLTVKQVTAQGSHSTQDTSSSSYTSSSSSSKVGESSTSQSQTSRSSSDQITNSTSTTSYTVRKMATNAEVAVWLPGKTIFEVESQVSVLTAGQVNSLPIIIRNVGTGVANSLSISVSLQALSATTGSAPVVIEGTDATWYVQNLNAGSNVTLDPQVFASTDAMDKAYVVQISLNYRDSVGTVRDEVHSIGFSVQGSIIIVVQSAFISPIPVGAGGNITVSGNILNEGNVAAMYTNATAIVEPPFETLDGSSIYLGELDPNTPLPFSLIMGIMSDTANGTYPLKVLFYYKDSFGDTHSVERAFNITVSGVYVPPKPQVRQVFFLFTPLGLSMTIVMVVAIIIVAYVFIRRRAHGK